MDGLRKECKTVENKFENWVRRFEVASPRKHQNGFTVYRVTSVVFPKSAPEAFTSVVVWKRFRDFKKLYENLRDCHKQYEILEEMPPMCKGKYFKRFDENVIKIRMDFALDLLNFVGRHQILFTSQSFLEFFNDSHQLMENGFSSYESPGTYVNGNDLEANLNFSSPSLRNNDSPSDCRKSNGLKLKKCDYSYEDSSLGSDTSNSTSPIHSNNKNIDSESAMDYSNNHTLVSDSSILKDSDKVENEVSEANCSSETLFPSSDVCLSIRTEDFETKNKPSTPFDPKDSSEASSAVILEQNYLVESAYHIGQAQKYEAEGQFEAAFCFYKAAIACLLSGVQEDEVSSRCEIVREKAQQYFLRAEKIYALYLAPERDTGPSELMGRIEELNVYKVVRIIDRVLLVLNTVDQKYYVIKVLQKSSCPLDGKKKTIIPYSVPHMVKLVKYMENENSIFLVLEYVSGGKLLDNLQKLSEPQSEVFRINDFNSCMFQDTSAYELANVEKSREVKHQRLSEQKPSLRIEQCQSEEYSPVKSESERENPKHESTDVDSFLEVTNLVRNSQKLLDSVNETLQKSEKLTSNLSKELIDIEAVFDLKCRFLPMEEANGDLLKRTKRKKRSRSAVVKSKLERSHSSEELSEFRSRTASSSLDRRNEWSNVGNASLRVPEALVKDWAAELLVAIETLHRWGIVCRDLHPGNILLTDDGHVLLTFQAHWKGVDSTISEESISGFYAAPENLSVYSITPAADWWSFGALLHRLLTGNALSVYYPDGIFGHTALVFPEYLSLEVSSLLRELLRHEPGERLGSGASGAEEIKCHPFFKSVDWQLVYDSS